MAHQKGPPQKLSAAEFARLFSEGRLAARDRFGNPIEKDTLVLYRPEVDVMYQVTDVKPIMDPRLPPGIKIIMKATVPMTLMANELVQNIVCIGQLPKPGEEGKPLVATGGQATDAGDAGDADHPEGPPNEQPPGVIELTDSSDSSPIDEATTHEPKDEPPHD